MSSAVSVPSQNDCDLTYVAGRHPRWPFLFFFNDTATTEIYTLSLHDALPISRELNRGTRVRGGAPVCHPVHRRSEEHTSELQSRLHLVCRLLLEKKKRMCPAPLH